MLSKFKKGILQGISNIISKPPSASFFNHCKHMSHQHKGVKFKKQNCLSSLTCWIIIMGWNWFLCEWVPFESVKKPHIIL